jgi:hypothetical protein
VNADVAFIGTVVSIEALDLLETPLDWPVRGARQPLVCDETPPPDPSTACVVARVYDGLEPASVAMVVSPDRSLEAGVTTVVEDGCVRLCDVPVGNGDGVATLLGGEGEVTRELELKAGATTVFEADLSGAADYLGQARVRMRVEEAYKGTCVGAVVEIVASRFEAMCAYGGLLDGIGERYAIYVRRHEGELRVSLCSGSHRLGTGELTEATRPPPAAPAAVQRCREGPRSDRDTAGHGCATCDASGAPSGAAALALLIAVVVLRPGRRGVKASPRSSDRRGRGRRRAAARSSARARRR